LSEAHKRTPRPVPERGDARNFPLSPTDGYVLSRVSGALNEVDLIASTGLPEAQVQASLAKLETLGLITFDGGSPAPSVESPRAPVTPRASVVQIRASTPAAPASPTVGPPPEDVELDPQLSRRVGDVHREMQQRDYYWLLGVEPKADKKAIKRAYYELAAVFHPDRYFRKRLGSFKVQMEAIFSRLTLAHDTLSAAETRTEYDEYLAEQRRSRAIEDDLADAPLRAQQAAETIARSIQAQEARVSAPPPAAPATVTPQTPPSTAPAVNVNVASRRNSLAKRLLGGAPGASSTPPSSGSSRTAASMQPPAIQTGEAMDALRRRYEDRLRLVRQGEALKYSKQADTALAAGELVAAATAFRIAANLATDDAELERKAQESRVKADVLLGDTYTRQARYEEAHDQWGEAARSWARVCKVRPDDANAHERASHAILKSGGDLREGARLARRACDIEPKNAFYRIALANCYAGAGLTLNARRELDTAAQLAPQDGTIQAMIRNVESRPDVARRE
jgi:curved DNA-binding protein CbpA